MSYPQFNRSGVRHLQQIEIDEMGGVTIAGLAAAATQPDHPFNATVTIKCHLCQAVSYETRALFAHQTCCDDCREKGLKAILIEKSKTYWQAICPPAFLETDKNHPDFPQAAYAATRDWLGGESLFLYGPSRTGKTRLGMWLLKRCLVRNSAHVGVLWPEQLKHVKYAHDRLELVEKWGRYEILLMDDALLTGAQDERITDWLKDLIDYRIRYKRPILITSQVGSDDYREQMDKFDNATKADKARVEALLRRVKETCRVVSFAPAVVSAGEEAF
jgi:DNA replication protein DnaC